MPLNIGVVRESAPGEHRAAIIPELNKKFQALGANILLENNVALDSHFMDASFEGARFGPSMSEIYGAANLILRVNFPSTVEIAAMPEGSVLIGLLKPFESKERLAALNARKITAFSLELLPRISRAQSMDALSSQGACAGSATSRWARISPSSRRGKPTGSATWCTAAPRAISIR